MTHLKPIGVALVAAGRDVEADRLYVAATQMLRACGGDVAMASRRLALSRDVELQAAVWRHYLADRIAPDMKGIRPETDGGGRPPRDTQSKPAPGNSDGGEGPVDDDTRYKLVPPSSDPVRDGAGHNGGDARMPLARPVAIPTEENRRAAASVAKAAARTIFDSVEIRGRPLARIAIGELAGLLSLNEQENALIRQMMRHAANTDPLAMVADVFKASDIERFRQKVAEMADAL